MHIDEINEVMRLATQRADLIDQKAAISNGYYSRRLPVAIFNANGTKIADIMLGGPECEIRIAIEKQLLAEIEKVEATLATTYQVRSD
mgnify:CR=1 FL=1